MDISNRLSLLIEKVKYEVQYIDYEEGQWTVPVILTKRRADRVISDNAIRKVRFTPILGGGGSFTFEHQYLTP